MPVENNFQHSEYERKDPGEHVAYRELPAGAPPDSPAWLDAMAEQGRQLEQARVRAVVFLHGALLGTDLFGAQRLDAVGGLKRGYSRGIPGMEALLALMRQETNGLSAPAGFSKPPFADDAATRKRFDELTGDAGNFTTAYVELFRKAISRNAARPFICARVVWSSEHHHLGRAQAAVRLLHRLRALCAEHSFGAGDRILLQAQGQAGLVAALLSNLLAKYQSSAHAAVLKVLKSVMPDSEISPIQTLLPSGDVLNGATLDVVTLGTPVRYGWESSGVGKLLHLVNHRPMRADGKRWLAKMELPQITMEMPIAWGGDYVQQLAVAGSDAVPTSEDAKAANKMLWEVMEPWEGFERWLECARKCVRCQNDGEGLLVDYKDSTGSTTARDHYYGHAAYTRTNAMLFNTTEIVRTLYASRS